jgi:integrase
VPRYNNVRPLPSGRFQARYRGPDGLRRSGTFVTAEEAARWVDKQRGIVAEGDWIAPEKGRTLFREWADRWMERRVDIGASTRARDASLMRNHLLPAFGDRALSAITQEDVAEWVAELTRKTSGRGGLLSEGSVRLCYVLVSSVMSEAVNARLIRVSPCYAVKLPSPTQREMRILTWGEVERLAAVMDERYRALVIIGCYAGPRIGELAALDRASVDLAGAKLRITRTATEVGGVLALKTPKTRAGRRTVPLHPRALEAISAHLDAFTAPSADDPLFPAPNGDRLRPNNFRERQWAPAVKAAGLAGLRLHDMRHTAVSLWIAEGTPMLYVSRWAGHTSTSFTQDRYGHLIEDIGEEYMARVGARADAARAAGGNVVPIRGTR